MFLTVKKLRLKINDKYLKYFLSDRLIFQLQGIKRIFCKFGLRLQNMIKAFIFCYLLFSTSEFYHSSAIFWWKPHIDYLEIKGDIKQNVFSFHPSREMYLLLCQNFHCWVRSAKCLVSVSNVTQLCLVACICLCLLWISSAVMNDIFA